MAKQSSAPGKNPGATSSTSTSKTKQAGNQAEKHADEAKQKASQAAAEVKRQAAEAGKEAKKQFDEASQAVRQQASEAANSLRAKGRRMAHEQKHRVANEIETCSAALRDAAQRYNQESETNLGRYASAAAEQLDRAKSYIEDRQLEGMLSDVERGVRGHRDLVYGACFVAGLGLARFLKASAEARHEEQSPELSPDSLERGQPVPRADGSGRRSPAYRSHVQPRHNTYTSVDTSPTSTGDFGSEADG